MFADKALRCDCGYEVRAHDEAACLDAVKRHASEAHGIDLPVEQALESSGALDSGRAANGT